MKSIDTGTNERASRKKTLNHCNYLRLLKLDPIIQTGIRDGFISMGHGRAIINIEDLDIQTDIYQRIVSKPVRSRYGSFSKKLSGKSKTETSGQDKGIVSI
jgi:ParB family chromosome partitioning protein